MDDGAGVEACILWAVALTFLLPPKISRKKKKKKKGTEVSQASLYSSKRTKSTKNNFFMGPLPAPLPPHALPRPSSASLFQVTPFSLFLLSALSGEERCPFSIIITRVV